jgi:hypothetical protein
VALGGSEERQLAERPLAVLGQAEEERPDVAQGAPRGHRVETPGLVGEPQEELLPGLGHQGQGVVGGERRRVEGEL